MAKRFRDVPESLGQHLVDFRDQIRTLPDPKEPPKTTLHILRSGQHEQAWQRFLFHFLTPTESHGLESALLEHFLSSLSEQYELDVPFSYFDIDDIQVETEVTLSNSGRADAVIWLPDAWFICWELKLHSSETGGQTDTYVEARSFESIEREKSEFEHHHYLYLAPESAPTPSSGAFESITWEWIASEIQAFLQEGDGQYPARTTSQLSDFVATIHHELNMTEYQEHEREKAQLYFEHYDEIKEAERSFENRWDEFFDNWGVRLAQSLDVCEIIDIPDLPDTFVVVDCEVGSDEVERWIFRQGNTDWAGIRKHGWKRDKTDLSAIYQSKEGREDFRINLYHRPELNRDLAIQEQTLELQLWHGTEQSDEFMHQFRDKLRSKTEASESSPPRSVSVKGTRGNPLSATYDISVGEHGDFFDAYVAALDNAFRDLVVDNRELIGIIDECYEEMLADFG